MGTQSGTKIINGLDSSIPIAWQVWLTFTNNLQHGICGGTLINPGWVLTAFHCIIYKEQRIAAGNFYNWFSLLWESNPSATDAFSIQTKRILEHPSHSTDPVPITSTYTLKNDFALLELASTIDLRTTTYVNAACLASIWSAGVDIGLVSGW